MSTITADTMAKLPERVSYGFTASPNYRSRASEREGGFERINRVWARPLLYITSARLEDTPITNVETVLAFFHAMGGQASYFRCKDHTDYQSCGVQSTPSRLDQPLVLKTGSSTEWQLCKNYTAGSITQRREIYKPIGSTILIANGGGVLQTDWTLDEATGILTKGGGFSGTPTTWGGQFDVEVRFMNDMLDVAIQNYGSRDTSFVLREKRRAAVT